MKTIDVVFILYLICLLSGCVNRDTTLNSKQILKPETPIMGWSSWNDFHVAIDENIIKSQADYMVSSGMKDAGYTYINIDDGFWGGRNEEGKLLAHPIKFPNGMKSVSDYIHGKGLKAGIYAEAGINTCASKWDRDSIGVGMGLYGHDRDDLTRLLDEWNYDFIKVDWCGGYWLGLDEQTRYTEIGQLIREIRPETIYNICRWEFPGTWAVTIADSWRISADIDNTFESILHIIDLNADLWRYCSPGRFNDMDMLQVGRGMTYEEDKAHFSMWCMMNSPLLAGNDLRKMSQRTIDVLTNQEVIALNQDPLCYQARRLVDYGELEVWAKPLGTVNNGKVAVALLNRTTENSKVVLDLDSVGIDATAGYKIRDLWSKADYPHSYELNQKFEVPAHGIIVIKIVGKSKHFNVFQYDEAHRSLLN